MLRRILKKIGRLFIILAHEDARIESKKIKKALLINLPSEEHLHKALPVIKERFKETEFTVVLPESKLDIVSGVILNRKNMKRLEKYNFDAVIILSLDPCLVWRVFRVFSCPKLLYNYCGEWYLVRRKSFYEFLAGEKAPIFYLPFQLVYIIARLLKLSLYLIFGFLFLFIRKLFIKKHTTSISRIKISTLPLFFV